MADEQVRRVLDATDLAGVIGEHVTLKPKGREFVGLCPFHDDRNPSMYVVPHKQLFHCFVCGAGGDALTFVRKLLGLSFPEALEHLAERAGIELDRRPRPAGAARNGGTDRAPDHGASREEILAANELALRFFRAILAHPEHGAAARALIERRGMGEAMVERFRIGAAPDRWDGLITYASDRGLSEAALLGAGLVKRRESGGVYDALRNRLIFPIADATGRPIAFGGRKILDEDEPKYLNSPETALFHKSRTLYGLDLAGKAIRAEKRAVVVEGYTDVIACHAAGIEHVVGTLGTALTAEHARFLRGRAEEIVLLFDGDEAGQRAADRAFEVLFRAMVDVRVATLAGNELAAKDPDELLASAGGRELFERALDGAEHITDFWARRLRERLAGAGPAAVAAAVKDELARLHDLGLGTVSPVERRLLLERLANSAGVPIEALLGQAPAGRRRGPEVREPESVRIRPKDAPDLWRLVLAGVMARPARSLERGELVLELIARMPEGPLWMTRVRDSIAALLAGGSPPGFAAVMREDGSELTEAAVSALGREHEHEFGDDITTAERMWEDAVERLRLTAPPRTGTAEGDGSSIEQEPGAGGLPASELEARMSRAREIGRRLGTNPTAHPALSRRRPRQ